MMSSKGGILPTWRRHRADTTRWLADSKGSSALDSHGEIDNVARRVDPNHETGGFAFFCPCLDFVESSGGEVNGGGFEESVEVTKRLKVLYCHEIISSGAWFERIIPFGGE